MLSLKNIVKKYQETGALNENINIFGFIDENTFITKAGDVGMVLELEGVDYECLDSRETDNLTKRLESALKLFDSKFRIYQYLFKANNPPIPHTPVADEIVRAAVEARLAYFETKAADLYSLNIYYAILYEGFRYQSNFVQAIGKVLSNPGAAWDELNALLSSRKQIVFVQSEIEKAQRILRQRTENFILQVNDFVKIRLLGRDDAYQFMRKLVNFGPEKRARHRLKYDTHVDFFMCDSSLECYPTHLQVDDLYVKVLTWKEPTGAELASDPEAAL